MQRNAISITLILLLVVGLIGGAVTLASSPTPQPTEPAIPEMIPSDTLTARSLAAVQQGAYVGQVVNPPIQVQDFVAPGSQDGLERLSDTSGTWRVLFFGYMHCPDFCPLTLVDYKRTKPLLGERADEVTFTWVSVDPVRDTPEAMGQYLANFDEDFVGFAPDDATLQRIQPDYDLYYSRRMNDESWSVYTVDHSTRSYLIDPDGVLRASFAYDTDPQQLADALLWYLDNAPTERN